MKRILILLVSMGLFCACCGDEPSDPCIDESKIDPTAACIEIYQPVCGCNGETYENYCFAEIAGVTEWTEGVCEDE